MLAAWTAPAQVVTVPRDVPVCPPPSYVSSTFRLAHVNNPALAVQFGPTPAGPEPQPGTNSGKCGISEIRVANGICPPGVLSHFAYDLFDFGSDANAPMTREFRQELHVNSFDGIPVGGRVKISELTFDSGETVGVYFDRGDAGSADLAVGYRECGSCLEVEVDRFAFPTGLPLELAVPMQLSWTTGRFLTKDRVNWVLGNGLQQATSSAGSVALRPGAQELAFSNGIVNGSCSGTTDTLVRFVQPRFVDLAASY
jgi:hypothetical protein